DGVLPVETSPGPAHIRREVERALARALAVRVTETLEGRLSELGRDALRWSIIHATESPTVEDLAMAIGRTPAAFARDLRERHLPPPRRILLWGRLFQGAHLMTRGDRSVEAVALRLGYSSRTALSRAFRRETGLPPTEVTRRGGISCVLEGFLVGGRRRGRSR
ncbi:MAG: AraC family transcriptional regulator, partial [Gemmatimonadetes bacterium]|nr:AraC family transcriptional regulator [Gemmatimonadota bacterium]